MPHATASAASSTVHMGERVHLDRTMTVLLVGVGGQGTILAGNILAMTASEAGLDVKVSEIHGMSQRGGSVSTIDASMTASEAGLVSDHHPMHGRASVSTIIRMGEHVDSMVCDPGTADVLVAFEAIEALRNQQFLKEGGRLFVNDETIVPVPVNIGNAQMPRRIGARLDEIGAVRIDAGEIARGVGSPRSTNVVLVGALSTALPFAVDEWRDAISRRVPPKTVEANLAAFDAGRKAAER